MIEKLGDSYTFKINDAINDVNYIKFFSCIDHNGTTDSCSR